MEHFGSLNLIIRTQIGFLQSQPMTAILLHIIQWYDADILPRAPRGGGGVRNSLT